MEQMKKPNGDQSRIRVNNPPQDGGLAVKNCLPHEDAATGAAALDAASRGPSPIGLRNQ